MIPFIRSLSELMAITEARDYQKGLSTHDLKKSSTLDSGQRKRYVRSIGKNKIVLPNVPKTFRNKWIKNKDHISKFIDDLDYNNQIQSSLDLILLERQNKNNRQDVA
jgi:hypothetical protein|tara:strand:+ start:307 stop:627 length:321 start_codon:yes stop_codon:yes gene_type:complete